MTMGSKTLFGSGGAGETSSGNAGATGGSGGVFRGGERARKLGAGQSGPRGFFKPVREPCSARNERGGLARRGGLRMLPCLFGENRAEKK